MAGWSDWRSALNGPSAQNSSGIERNATPDPGYRQIPARRAARLFGEQRSEIGERLDFDGVARRVEKEHGGLLAGLALEADVGLDNELSPGRFEFIGQQLPLRQREHG